MYFKIPMYYHNLAVNHDNKYWLVVLTILKDITVVNGKYYPIYYVQIKFMFQTTNQLCNGYYGYYCYYNNGMTITDWSYCNIHEKCDYNGPG